MMLHVFDTAMKRCLICESAALKIAPERDREIDLHARHRQPRHAHAFPPFMPDMIALSLRANAAEVCLLTPAAGTQLPKFHASSRCFFVY